MSLLSLSGVSFAYSAGLPVFENATFTINPGDRIAIVGPNGAGKSTLLHLLAGDLLPISGNLVKRHPLTVLLAEQSLPAGIAPTLFDYVFGDSGPLAEARNEIRALEAHLSDTECALQYSSCIDEYQKAGGYAAENAVERILTGLGWTTDDFDRDVRTLSGGERTRAALARALSAPSDLLILDEPTNHLDLHAREWLEEHLRKRQSAVVFTSHDRSLLASVATRIVEIERGKVRLFDGGFDEYRQSRALLDRQAWDSYNAFERRKAAAEQAAERRERLAKRVAATPEGTAGVRNPFYAAKSARVARTARILRERASDDDRVDKPWEDQPISTLTFDHVLRSGEIVLSVDHLTKQHGAKLLFRDLTFVLRRGDRLVIRGANGSGKTTLLNLILGHDQPDSGAVRFGANVQLASVDQVTPASDLDRSPLEICGTSANARTLLGCLKLRPDRLNRPLRELSGGERTKVALARALNSGANLLLLDEPTNNLEIEAQEALEQALQLHPGTLILVSHDRSFLESLGPEITYLDLG